MGMMNIKQKSAASDKPKPKAKPRTQPRVSESGKGSMPPNKDATRNTVPTAVAVNHGDGIECWVQNSETVRVAEFANVVLGPVGMRFTIANPGIEKLGEVDWADEDTPLTDEEQSAYDKLRGVLQAASTVITHHINDDRDLVEASVAAATAREAAESEKKSSGRRSKK